jgi:hypothetical protein
LNNGSTVSKSDILGSQLVHFAMGDENAHREWHCSGIFLGSGLDKHCRTRTIHPLTLCRKAYSTFVPYLCEYWMTYPLLVNEQCSFAATKFSSPRRGRRPLPRHCECQTETNEAQVDYIYGMPIGGCLFMISTPIFEFLTQLDDTL